MLRHLRSTRNGRVPVPRAAEEPDRTAEGETKRYSGAPRRPRSETRRRRHDVLRGGGGNHALRRLGGGRRCERLILPRTSRRDHAITEPRHVGDVTRLPGVVTEYPAERRHRLIDRVRADDHPRPDVLEQILDADDLAGMVGEVDQQSHRPRFQPGRCSIARDLSGLRIDAPVADAQHRCRRGLHPGSGLGIACQRVRDPGCLTSTVGAKI